jgi:hypothetical protein
MIGERKIQMMLPAFVFHGGVFAPACRQKQVAHFIVPFP